MANEIDYRRLAEHMRAQNPLPNVSMAPSEYYAGQAIFALIRALEAMSD